jgi:30S ribosomal protein S31
LTTSAKEAYMGKGDRRSRKGKIWRGTYGKTRPRKKAKRAKKATAPKAPKAS